MSEQIPSNDAPREGVLNDRYRIVKSLGRGGMGEVFLVEDMLRENQKMALKTLLPQTTDHLLTSGFRDEFAELAKLRHANLAAAFDFGRIVGTDEYFFTTEFIQGVDLMKGTKEASVEQLIQVTAQLLRGLDFLHNHHLLHNDLKPANILLGSAAADDDGENDQGDLNKLESLIYGDCGRVKIIDFGLICREHVATEKILGTLRYISPERIQKVPADRRSDLYSIGAVIFTLFARKVPFDDKDVRKLLRMHLEQPAPPIQRFRRDLPPVISELISRLLRKSPVDRFPSAGAALDFLGKALGWKASEEVSRWNGKRLTAGALLFRGPHHETLKSSYDDVCKEGDSDHVLVIEGGAGVGKSRLVEELRSPVQVSDGVFIDASGPVVEGNLQPVSEAIMAGMRTSGVRGLAEFQKTLDDGGKDNANNLASTLENIVLTCAKDVPILLHFDDFDRASDTVTRFALELVHTASYPARRNSETCKLLVVVSRRVDAHGKSSQLGDAKTIQLENFEPEVAGDFLRRIFGQDDIPDAVLNRLVSISSGNPLFLLELSNNLLDNKKISYSGSSWTFPDTLEGISLPESLGNLFEEKLASLGKEGLEILYWIAVSGRPLPLKVLVRCLRFQSEKLDQFVEELSNKNLIAANEKDGEVEYILSHAGSREALCERLPDDRLAQIHQRIAQNVEEEYPQWRGRADELAEHWLASGNEAGFLRFAPDAAELLRERGDFERAVDYHQRLVDAMPDNAVAKKVQSLSKLSEMHEILWDLDACMNDLRKIETLGAKLMKPQDRALLMRRIACVEISRHRYRVAEKLLSSAQDLLGANAPPLLTLAIEAPRAWTLWFTGRHSPAQIMLERCRETISACEPSSPKEKMILIGSINFIANFVHYRGELQLATQLYQRNLEMLRGLDQAQAECATHCALGGVLLERGEIADAEKHLEICLETSKEIGDRRALTKARERYGDYQLRFGRFRQALQTTQAALQDAETLDNSTSIANSLRTLGRIYLFADQSGDAMQVLERAVSLQEDCRDVFSTIQCKIVLSQLQIKSGDLAAARENLEHCDAEAREHQLPVLQAQTSLWLFFLDWQQNQNYNADRIDAARKFFSGKGYALEQVDLVLAQLEVVLEDPRRGIQAEELLMELQEISSNSDLPDLTDEIEYFHAKDCVRRGELARAATTLKQLYKRCKGKSKLRLARRSRELFEKATEAVQKAENEGVTA